jgi:putative nucleotidyltransferase with HDIG domain
MALLKEYTKSPNLIKHALAVEAAMRSYAAKFGGDVERWGIVGLLHDFDYETYPDLKDHPLKGSEILREKGYPEDVIYAIKSHGVHLGLPRMGLMDKALFAVDELTGFIVAVALVRPSRSIMEVDVEAVKKKMKSKAFAAGVKREDIVKGSQELGVSLDEHIDRVIKAMQAIADGLGLK